jgi:hypothetical protein
MKAKGPEALEAPPARLAADGGIDTMTTNDTPRSTPDDEPAAVRLDFRHLERAGFPAGGAEPPSEAEVKQHLRRLLGPIAGGDGQAMREAAVLHAAWVQHFNGFPTGRSVSEEDRGRYLLDAANTLELAIQGASTTEIDGLLVKAWLLRQDLQDRASPERAAELGSASLVDGLARLAELEGRRHG